MRLRSCLSRLRSGCSEFLQEGTIERLGGTMALPVDVRIVAATHRDLHEMVVRGTFREDLWHLISVFPNPVAATTRTSRGHPAARHTLCGTRGHATRRCAAHANVRGARASARVRLARECTRTCGSDRASCDFGPRPPPTSRSGARRDACGEPENRVAYGLGLDTGSGDPAHTRAGDASPYRARPPRRERTCGGPSWSSGTVGHQSAHASCTHAKAECECGNNFAVALPARTIDLTRSVPSTSPWPITFPERCSLRAAVSKASAVPRGDSRSIRTRSGHECASSG